MIDDLLHFRLEPLKFDISVAVIYLQLDSPVSHPTGLVTFS